MPAVRRLLLALLALACAGVSLAPGPAAAQIIKGTRGADMLRAAGGDRVLARGGDDRVTVRASDWTFTVDCAGGRDRVTVQLPRSLARTAGARRSARRRTRGCESVAVQSMSGGPPVATTSLATTEVAATDARRTATTKPHPSPASAPAPVVTPTPDPTPTPLPAPAPAPTPAPAPAPASLQVGINNSVGWGAADARRARQAGFTADRQEFTPQTTVQQNDARFATAAAAGLRVLPLLNQYTPLAALDTTAMAAWAGAFANRYAAGGTFWAGRSDGALAPTAIELFNEAYGAWAFAKVDPAAYTRVAGAMARAIHVAAPGLKVLAAGSCDVQVGGLWKPWIDWLADSDATLADWADGFTVHPYGALVGGDPNWTFGCLDRLHADLVRRKLDRPVWITEAGQTTAGAGAVSAQQQAEAEAFYIQQAAQRPWVAGVFLYGWRDSGTDPVDGEQHYGQLDFDGTAKPGLALASAAIAALGGR